MFRLLVDKQVKNADGWDIGQLRQTAELKAIAANMKGVDKVRKKKRIG
jgi:hypothetical protein